MGWRFLHWSLDLHEGQRIQVTLTDGACVRFLDEGNFQAYRAGKRFNFYGGQAKRSPLFLAPPRPGPWHFVIDSGAGKYSVQVLDPPVWELAMRADESIEERHVPVMLKLRPQTFDAVRRMAARHCATPAALVETLLELVTRGGPDERSRAGKRPAVSPGGNPPQMARQRGQRKGLEVPRPAPHDDPFGEG